MKHIFCILFLLNGLMSVCANTIRLDFSKHPDKLVSLTYKYGTKEEIVFNGTTNDKGQINMEIPQQHADYVGMASLKVGDNIQIDFIVNNENPVLKSDEEQFNSATILFENSPENENLQKWFTENSVRMEKMSYASQLIRFYKEKDRFFPALKKELETLEKEQIAFDGMLRTSDLYVAKFIQLHVFQNNGVNALVYMDSLQTSMVRKHILEELDINALFTSGLWFNTLNGLLAMYDKEMPFHEVFIDDMSVLLKRAGNDRVYTGLAENLFEICEAMDWQQQGEQLVYFILDDKRIVSPQGKLKRLLDIYKLRKGNPAPALMQGKLSDKKQNILIFYENGCISCQTELENFVINYSDLLENEFEIITISADMDEEMFHRLADTFPWQQKYCDFKGFESTDFKNYGIIGTPTIFLIDNEGIIQGRYARFKDLMQAK